MKISCRTIEVVEIMDAHKGFDIITASIKATKKRELVIIIGVLTFLFLGILKISRMCEKMVIGKKPCWM